MVMLHPGFGVGWRRCERPELDNFFCSRSYQNYNSSYRHQTDMDGASWPTYWLKRLEYWILPIKFRCRRLRYFELVKVVKGGTLWGLYLSNYCSLLHYTGMEYAFYRTYALERLECWFWAIGFRCWMRLRFLE